MRHLFLLALLGCSVILLQACGEPEQARGPEREQPAAAPDVQPHREVIDPAIEAKVRERSLAARDTPIAVGATAPPIEALEPGVPALVVFYRGHW